MVVPTCGGFVSKSFYKTYLYVI